ncbi:MAG TPA: hypothetical protein VKB88_33125, partial [Bryobacteraceae bacterium]|nr:hypothetical protein [Bryobacteraceae bacterium]
MTDYDDGRLRQAALAAGACEYPFLSLGEPTMSHRVSFFSTGTTRARAVLGAFLMYLSALPARSQQTSPPGQQPVNVNPVAGTVNQQQQVVLTQGPTITISGPLNVSPVNPVAAQPTMISPMVLWNPSMAPSGAGTMLCNDAGLKGACGTTDADYVGAYKLNMNCDSGFYDPIWGGSCWKCPNEDDKGSWLRNVTSVESDDACWRVPKEKLSKAAFIKTGWAWDCGSGQFWDQHNADGSWIWWGGACWKCPDDYPRRTAYIVSGNQACATPVHETARAQFLKYNGCPKPDPATMYPNKAAGDKRLPGNPFLDIASGISVANNAGGACFSCPVSDKDGNFLVTVRNANTLIGRATGNNGCTIQYKYKPPVFPEPGLSGLVGVKEVLFEKQIFSRPDDLTRYLYGIAAAAGTDKVPDAKAWVANQWADIAQHPYRNSQIRALVLQYLLDEAPSMMYPGGTVPTAPTPAETKLRNSFQSYAQARRTYLAQQGLYMYDAWKASTDQYKQSLAQNLGTLFDYGVVPIDFKHMLASLGSVSAAGVGVVGAYAAAQIFASQVELIKGFDFAEKPTYVASRATSLFGMQGLRFFQNGLSTVGALGGALAIQAVFAILTSVAMDQFMEILTARDKLVAAIEAAKQPVDLHTLNAD